MRSDYEISVLKELRRGNTNPEKISEKTGIPVDVVRVILRVCEDDALVESSGNKITADRKTVELVVDVLIIYIVLNLLIRLVWWLR